MKSCVLFLLVASSLALADPTEFPVHGFTITQDVMLPVSPARAFDLMTGDISGWWDHHFAEHPKALYIEPKPGGGFFEIFDDAGHGVRHAVVTWADPGKHLRFEGPLGLAGRALTMVTTWDYAPVGDSTKITCTVNLSGQIDADFAKVVEGVWHHFLVEQLQPWVAAHKN
jgi:hypothetical protein